MITRSSRFLFVGFLIFLLAGRGRSLPDIIKIGGLFDSSDDEQERAFKIAVDWLNSERQILPKSRLKAVVERLPEGDSYAASKKVCKLMSEGVAGVFGPQNAVTSMHVGSVCDEMEVAHIETRWDHLRKRDDLSINLYPTPLALSLAYLDTVKKLGWSNFTIVFEEAEGMIRFQDFFREAVNNKWNIQLYTFEENKPYRDVFWTMKKDLAKLKETDQKFILDVSRENLITVLKHAQQVGMVTENQHYLVTCLDLHTLELEDFKYGKSTILGFRLIQESNIEYQTLIQEITARSNPERFDKERRFGLKTQTTLMYDAVKLFVKALQQIDDVKEVEGFPNVSCASGAKGTEAHGTSLINYMKSSIMNGMTGSIMFDGEGFRSFIKLDIVFLTEHGLTKIGEYLSHDGANITKNITSKANGYHKMYKITTIVEPPYVTLKNSTKGLVGNERFEGFCIDLIEALSAILHFSYEIREVKDGIYGEENSEGNWTGMIGEVMNGDADMALAGLSISSKREKAVDFTMPFMNTGISILFRKPTTKVKSLFSFLSPFSTEVWIYLMASYLAVSIVMYWVGRLTPYEWINNHPCRQDDVIVENTFNLRNSLWFMTGSLMQQGSDLIPTAICTRTVASFWNFFTLIMISSYTANLAAFLTVEKAVYPIENVQDLAKQTKIKYGCKKSGSTKTFFEESNNAVYKKMWKFMSKSPTGLLSETDEAVAKVKEGNYAFFMESATIRYFKERHCTLTEIGGLLDSKGYGIAVKKGNRYLASFLSDGILELQEDGTIHNLREKWWKQKGGGQCGISKPSTVSKLGLGNVGGVFVMLIFGLIIATLIALFEYWWKSRHLENPNQESFWKRIMEEVKFALLCENSTKPVPVYKKSSGPQSTLNSRSSIPSQVTNRSV